MFVVCVTVRTIRSIVIIEIDLINIEKLIMWLKLCWLWWWWWLRRRIIMCVLTLKKWCVRMLLLWITKYTSVHWRHGWTGYKLKILMLISFIIITFGVGVGVAHYFVLNTFVIINIASVNVATSTAIRNTIVIVTVIVTVTGTLTVTTSDKCHITFLVMRYCWNG